MGVVISSLVFLHSHPVIQLTLDKLNLVIIYPFYSCQTRQTLQVAVGLLDYIKSGLTIKKDIMSTFYGILTDAS